MEGSLISAVLMNVQHAREDFVVGVEWRPDAFAGFQPIEQREGKGTQVSVAQFLLTLRQFGNHVLCLALQLGVASRRVHQGTSRKIMANEVAAQFDVWFLPTAEWFGGRWQTRVNP